MRILVAGADKIFAIENIYVRYLRQAGHTVHHFSSRSIFLDYYQKNIRNKILFRLGISGIYRDINDHLKKRITEFNPEVIWIFKGMEIFPETLQWARERNIKLVNYNADNPFMFLGNGSGNANLTKSLSFYHLHFTYNHSVLYRFQKELKLKSALLPFGFDVDESIFKECEQEEEICEVCFLGNPDKSRASFLQAMADREIPVAVYGKDWKRFIKHKYIKVHGSVFGEELWKVLRKYRVQMNLIRAHNEDSHNMRTFEVPAIGGIMVAPNTSDHRRYFQNEKEVILFDDLEDCIKKVKAVLTLSKDEADKIRDAARLRSLQSFYSYEYRTQDVIKELSVL